MLSFLSLPAYANDDEALLQFFMQGGSIMYVLFLAYFIISNSKARMALFVVYLSLTVIGYLVASSTASEFNILLTIFTCIFIPLVTTIILAFIIAMREN